MIITITNKLRLSEIPDEIGKILIDRMQLPNPKWLENERMGRWNKKTPKYLTFYTKAKNGDLIIPRGYARRLILLCKRHEEPYQIVDKRRVLPEIDYQFRGNLKPFQQEAVNAMLSKDFGVLNSPTGSGKTVMALYMIAHRRQPALIIVHTKDLAFQWIERIGDFLGIKEEDVGMIGAGKGTVGERITLALVQSLYKRADEVRTRIGYVITDECHRAPSRTFTEAVSAFDAKYMLGLSATPWRRDRLSQVIYWHLGDQHHQVQTAGLIEDGHILQAEIILRYTAFKPHFDPVNEYSSMLSELTADDTRNRLIVSDIAKEAQSGQGICLVLTDRKKHCETLRFLLQYAHKVPAEILTGDVGQAARKEIIEKLNRGEAKVLIATGQLVGEGFDCKGLSTLFIATPIRFGGRVLQYLGRVLRPAAGKEQARVFDYVDVEVGPLMAAAKSRQGIYERMRSDSDISPIPEGFS